MCILSSSSELWATGTKTLFYEPWLPSVGHIKWHLHAGYFVRLEAKLLFAMLLLLLLLSWLWFIWKGHCYRVRMILILLLCRHMLIKWRPKVHMWRMSMTVLCQRLTPHWPIALYYTTYHNNTLCSTSLSLLKTLLKRNAQNKQLWCCSKRTNRPLIHVWDEVSWSHHLKNIQHKLMH